MSIPTTTPIHPSVLRLDSNQLLVSVVSDGCIHLVQVDEMATKDITVDISDPINDQLILPIQSPIHLLATKTGIQVYKITVAFYVC